MRLWVLSANVVIKAWWQSMEVHRCSGTRGNSHFVCSVQRSLSFWATAMVWCLVNQFHQSWRSWRTTSCVKKVNECLYGDSMSGLKLLEAPDGP